MAVMNTGGSFANRLVNRSPMSSYDALPQRIRKLLADAPYDYSTESIARKLRECGPDLTEAKMISVMPEQIRMNALAIYGPDHPQAQ